MTRIVELRSALLNCTAERRRHVGLCHALTMEPMFLPDVENNPKPSPYADMIRTMKATGDEYSQIWHLFAYLPNATEHLARFTQEILRGPAPLSAGVRELIAAYTSYRNNCPF